jgi:hypothetical protein
LNYFLPIYIKGNKWFKEVINMELSILNRVAQIVTNSKIDQALGNKQPAVSRRQPSDVVSLSGSASDERTIASRLAAIENGEPERAEKLESIKAKVRSKTYAMTPEMVDSIAEKIAKTLT